MILPFVFLPFVFINLLRQIFVSISNFSYDNCCDNPMSSLNQQSEPLKLKNVSSLVLVFSKYVNSDKKLPKMPMLLHFLTKHAYAVTILQKRKQLLGIFSFQYGTISIRKKATFSVIFGKNQNKIVQKLIICSEIWHFWKR